jgi:two-component system, LytTR family, response regulator
VSARALRAIVVDDEPLVRERLRSLLEDDGDVSIVAECSDGQSAVAAIARERPDVVFLDIQMPELDGFEVLEALDPDAAPAVVFVTAYDDHAIRAFEVHAVDYVLKPIEPARVQLALARVRQRVSTSDRTSVDERLEALLDRVRDDRRRAVRFVVRTGDTISFVRADDVDWIEADGNYARLHYQGRNSLVRSTMKSLAARLDPDRFVRVHRSVIVNADRIATLEPYFHGEYVITMKDGAKLHSSRSYSEELQRMIR